MLVVENLSASYGKRQVLNNISFQIPKGSNLLILGPNGCGKTTLLRCIAGLRPFTGNISINGINIMDLAVKDISKKIALMSQFCSIDYGYTVEQAIAMGRYAHLKNGLLRASVSKEDWTIIHECIERAGLTGLEKRNIKKLSGGQLQRVFFARALAQCTELILLDEPTNHLDLRHQVELMNHIKNWSEGFHHTAVGVFHDLNQAIQLGDYAIILKDGVLIEKGYIDKIITKDLLISVYGLDVVSYMLESLDKWKDFR
jgi:iron complex transport system ATP-binding protein